MRKNGYATGARAARAGLPKLSHRQWRAAGNDPTEHASYARGYKATFDAMTHEERKTAALTIV